MRPRRRLSDSSSSFATERSKCRRSSSVKLNSLRKGRIDLKHHAILVEIEHERVEAGNRPAARRTHCNRPRRGRYNDPAGSATAARRQRFPPEPTEPDSLEPPQIVLGQSHARTHTARVTVVSKARVCGDGIPIHPAILADLRKKERVGGGGRGVGENSEFEIRNSEKRSRRFEAENGPQTNAARRRLSQHFTLRVPRSV